MRGRFLLVLSLAVVLTACASATKPVTPSKEEPEEVAAASPQDQLSEALRTRAFTAVLRTRAGASTTVYLASKDENVQTASAPSCMANTGDQVRRGRFSIWLESKADGHLQEQDVSLFDGQVLEFNEQRPDMFQVLRDGADRADLLAVFQYASCNSKLVSLFALDSDGTRLLQYRFRTEKGDADFLQVSTLEQGASGTLKTTFYNNALQTSTVTTWEVKDAEALLVSGVK